MIPAYLKKKEERIPCAALLHTRNIVALEWPLKMSKLSGPERVFKYVRKNVYYLYELFRNMI